MREIAVRGFMNEKFNTTFGKGLFRRAMFNGSVELGSPNQKYLVDYFEYSNWENTAKTDEQMVTVRKLSDAGIAGQAGVLMSWIQHYDPLTKTKQGVGGFSIYSPETKELHVEIEDPANNTKDSWTLDVHLCKSTGANKPVFIATNVDLN